MTRFQWACCVSLVFYVAVTGCKDKGPAVGTVTGTIKLEGEPVENAHVTFMPRFPGGTEVASKTDANGFYEMQYSLEKKGVLLGKHQVQISTRASLKNPDGSNREIKERMPRHYYGPDSILEFDVKEGENVANFDLSKKTK